MTSDGNHTYGYDAENRLISVDGGATASYTYSADGLRVRSTVGGLFSDYIHDLDGSTVGVIGANGTLIRQEIGGMATYSDVAYFQHRDWLGNLRAITDYSGALRQTCTNLPFGDGLTCNSSEITPTHFTGYSRDSESGLDFANARYFTSQFGRFVSPDPMGGDPADPQSLNRYAYANNSPLSRIDPSGMAPDCPGTFCFWGSGGGSAGGAGISGGSFGGGDGSGGVGGGGSLGLCALFDCGFGGSGPSLPGPPTSGQIGSEASFEGSSQAGIGNGYDAYRQAVLAAGDVPLDPLGYGVIHQQHQIWNSAYSWGKAAFWGTAGVVAAPFAADAAVAVPGVATHLAARGYGWYLGYAGGTGVVLGQFDEYTNYVDAAESMGANVLNVSKQTYSFFANAGEWWTLNQSFLQASIARGQQFIMSSPVLGATGNFTRELEYLISRGIGPDQWIVVPLH